MSVAGAVAVLDKFNGLAQAAEALLAGRPTVGFEDVQAVAPNVIAHRLGLASGGLEDTGLSLTEKIIRTVPVP